MNNLIKYHVNLLLILAGLSAIVYTAAGFDGLLVTWALRLVGIVFIGRGVTLPASVSTEV